MQSSAISALRLAVIIAIMLFLIVVIVRLDCIEEKPSAGVSGARTSLTGEGREATIERSVREFSHDFIVTKGEKVVFDNHARIVFSNHADLVVKGSLSVIGTEQDPVVLQMGKGMIRLEEGASLTLEHCTLTGEDSDELSLFHSRDASFSIKNVTVINTRRKIIYNIEASMDSLQQEFVAPRCYGVKTDDYISAVECSSIVNIYNFDTSENIATSFDGKYFKFFIWGNIGIYDSNMNEIEGARYDCAITCIKDSQISVPIQVKSASFCVFYGRQPYAYDYGYGGVPIDFSVESCEMHDLSVNIDSMRPYEGIISLPYAKCKLYYDIVYDVDNIIRNETKSNDPNPFSNYMNDITLYWLAKFCILNIKRNEIYITIRKDQEKRVREEMAKHKLDIQEDGKYYRVIPLVNNE